MAARKKAAKKTMKKLTAKKTTTKRTLGARKTTKATKRTTSTTATTARKTAKTPAIKKAPPAKINVGKKPYSKSEFIHTISEQTGLTRKEVSTFLDTISKIIGAHVQKQGPEMFSWPGLFKIQVVRKPATKQRKGVNPFTGEPTIFKAKPATRRVKIRPLKQLKDMAA